MKNVFLILCLFLTASLLGSQELISQTIKKGKGWSNSNGKNTIAPPKGESLPVPLVVEILKKAAPVFNKPLGTMLSAYTAGTCCLLEITQLGERGRTFLVTYGGGNILIVIDTDY